MIALLEGDLIDSIPGKVILNVHGIGYEISVPMSTYEKLPLPPASTKLFTHLSIKENEHSLYGFATKQEKDLFTLLIAHVSGVGPKLALAVLSGASPDQFRSAVASQDTASLARIKGLGKKTAERIIVELKDKMGVTEGWVPSASDIAAPASRVAQDALLALMSLGYKQAEAQKAIAAAGPIEDLQTLIRESLKRI